MKISNFLIIPFLLLIGCQEEREIKTPEKITRNQENMDEQETESGEEADKVEIFSLPIHFDSSEYLIFAEGYYRYNDRTSGIYKSSSRSTGNFSQFTGSGNMFSGDISNLYFQHIDSGNFIPLTNQTLKIRSFSFLFSLYKKSGKKMILYTVTDSDDNGDGEYDLNDTESLYLSNEDGSNFRKLTPDGQELMDWKIVELQNRIYFRTIEDNDSNGELNPGDRIHYFFYDFDGKDQEIKSFYPVKD